MGTTRREFLAGGAILGVAAIAGLGGCASPTQTKSPESETDALATTGEESSGAVHNPVSTESIDVLVVGSGTAGTCAALRAAELGASVLCIEKRDVLMGTSAVAEGFAAVGSKVQKELGLDMDPGQVVSDILRYHHGACNGSVVATMINSSGASVDWLGEHGIEFGKVTGLGDSYPTWHIPSDKEGKMTNVGYVLGVLQDDAQKLGVEFRTDAPMSGLVVENGKVMGVYAQTPDGEVQINAKAVILATGGWASNPTMFENLTGIPYDNVCVWGFDGRDGDGITIAMDEAGAVTHHPDGVMWTCGAFDDTTAFNDFPNFIMAMQPSLHINENAQRYFNEGLTSDMTCCGNAMISQAGNYIIVDTDYIDHIETKGPWKGMPNLGAFAGEPYECREGIEAATGLVRTDTIEDMANQLGLDATALQATIDRYNSFCEKGVDEDFGKSADMLLPVKNPPFFGGKIRPALFTTVGGLKINANMQAVRVDGTAIEGLYAVGGDANGMYGSNYDVDVTSGGQQGWCLTSGRLAAESIMAEQV